MNREKFTYLRRLFIAILVGLIATPLLRQSLGTIDQQMTDCRHEQCAICLNHVNTIDVEMNGECVSGTQYVFRNVETNLHVVVAKTRHIEEIYFASVGKFIVNNGVHHIIQRRACDYYVFTLRKLLI